MTTGRPLAVDPIVSVPRAMRPGHQYLLSIDLRPSAAAALWPYEAEEYVVYFTLASDPLVAVEPIGEPAVVLHRFGGTYGPARFLLTAGARAGQAKVRVGMLNGRGMPVGSFGLPAIAVIEDHKAAGAEARRVDVRVRRPAAEPAGHAQPRGRRKARRLPDDGDTNKEQSGDVPPPPRSSLKPTHPDPDYGNRGGYDPKFLGEALRIPLPVLSPELAEKAIQVTSNSLETDPWELKYNHFSVVIHRERRFAIYAAFNMDGQTTRTTPHPVDRWLNDPRLAPTEQVGREFYTGRDFDRGRLVRRQRVAWGDTDETAESAAQDTVHFTNVVPKHARFNQAKSVWNGLENYLLKRAFGQRLTVFTGPVFDDGDPVHREVKVPQSFWKVAVSVRDDGKLAALAFLVRVANIPSQDAESPPEDKPTSERHDDARETNDHFPGLRERRPFADWSDRAKPGDHQAFQVTLDQIESMTGLEFGVVLHASDVFAGPAREIVESPDVEASSDIPPGVDTPSGREIHKLTSHTSGVRGVSFRPDGKSIASASADGTVRVWDAARGQEWHRLMKQPGVVAGVSFSPDGWRIASACSDQSVRFWDYQGGREMLVLKGHTAEVRGVSFSPDGRRIASASDDRTVRVWDAATGQQTLTLSGHDRIVKGVSFSPDGRHIASASSDRSVRVWDAQTGRQTFALKGHTGGVNGVSFSPDGRRIVSASDDRTVRVWDAETGQVMLSLMGHSGGVTAVSFSPDGRRIVSASDDRTVRVWDAETGQVMLSLMGHSGGVTAVSFSPDGRSIASASHDMTVRVWDAWTGQVLLTLTGHTDAVNGVSFSPDGRYIASASSDATVRVWDAAVPAGAPETPSAAESANGTVPEPSQDQPPTPDFVYVNGIDATTGDYVTPPLPLDVVARLAMGEAIDPSDLSDRNAKLRRETESHF